MSLKTYINNFPDCSSVLKNKHILFDADVIINLLDDFNKDLLNELKTINTTFTTIHPVLVELLNTNNQVKRTQRQSMLSEYNFQILPLIKENFDFARNIQTWLSQKQCFPSPTDLYLGSMLMKYEENLLLATSNLKDFQHPLFERNCLAVVQSSNRVGTINFITGNKKLLTEELKKINQ